jgi:hypothetical protein
MDRRDKIYLLFRSGRCNARGGGVAVFRAVLMWACALRASTSPPDHCAMIKTCCC